MGRLAKQDVSMIVDECKKRGRPFVVRFEKADGSIRTMLCSTTSGEEFVKGTGDDPDRDDDAECVTVFSLDVFAEQIADGVSRERAGRNSYRRFKLNSVIRIEPC